MCMSSWYNNLCVYACYMYMFVYMYIFANIASKNETTLWTTWPCATWCAIWFFVDSLFDLGWHCVCPHSRQRRGGSFISASPLVRVRVQRCSVIALCDMTCYLVFVDRFFWLGMTCVCPHSRQRRGGSFISASPLVGQVRVMLSYCLVSES